ncbi:MAG: CHAT domain-containing protein, partial [Cyanobacteria bacterium J06635_15]
GVQEADILPYAQALYQALLLPAREEGIIPAEGELSFILDAPFQGIPMAMLHDGQQYLIESYGISNALRSQQSATQKLESDRALVAGLSEASPSFGDPLVPSQLQPLADTEFEVQGIEKYLSVRVLLNEAFTASRLEREADDDYQVVHISTHGQFSSDPDQTFLMAWDELIDMKQMYRIFQDERSETGIDLLVLSACQTAKGDERSALGMAGIVVQAGARSTVASLWLVDSASSAVLMEEFYKGLSSGMSKSEALRQAQLVLLNSTVFNHPFYWAPFIFAEGGG